MLKDGDGGGLLANAFSNCAQRFASLPPDGFYRFSCLRPLSFVERGSSIP